MKILMMTNTYAPMVGGIEESIRSFTSEFEKLGHEVFIVAPDCEGVPLDEVGVVRVRALQNFNNSHFSIVLPISGLLTELMKTFKPDIIHCHHPFWMGSIALRLSSQYRIPLVFTHHTMFEQHMHYLPIQNDGMQRFIIELFTGYANLATQVIVPSESVRKILLERGVQTPIEVAPTGVDLRKFSKGNGDVIRKRFGIPQDAIIIGYIGRVALEKNLEFLARSIAEYLKKEIKAHFLLGGDGPLKDTIKKIFDEQGVSKRVHWAGVLKGQDLVDCYHAMNIFAFASLSETQGIVLVEAMAAGVPVVAIDAPGVREVVKDGYNGRLIFGENQDNLVEALSWCMKQPPSEFEQMRKNALMTTKEFAVDRCAARMLKVYNQVMAKEFAIPDYKNSAWNALTDRLKNEWHMFKNMMHAGGAAMTEPPADIPIQKQLVSFIAQLPRLLSLSEWSTNLLRLPKIEGVETEPGLVLIQIDGFSENTLKEAFSRHEMPFLKSLLQKENYKLFAHYPGLPSSTPSVQGELFYGVKQIVPAFNFLDQPSGKIFRMFDSEAALEIEKRLATQGEGLLKGGSSYSNIFSGGAQESHFCATSFGWSHIWKDANPVNFVILALTHLPSVLRMLVLTAWEFVLGIIDFGFSLFHGENLKKEWKFIHYRALLCVLLRELVTIGVKIDITRGLPIIHLNFIGYDEHAHNRGPSSLSAHWTLKGIDRAIEKIYQHALHSHRRSYDVWVYSDHGQEDTVSYTTKYNRNVQEAVAEIFKEFDPMADLLPLDKNGLQLQRVRYLGLSSIEKIFSQPIIDENNSIEKKLVVTCMGPTGNIYLPRKLSIEQMRLFAQKLVDQAKIPVVMLPQEGGKVGVWTPDGEFSLPKDAKIILGEGHPFLNQVTEDLIRVCHHSSAGDFTFMGYRPGHKPVNFPLEKGNHGGPGPQETNGFALLPIDIIVKNKEQEFLTPTDIHIAAMRFLKRPITSELNQSSEICTGKSKKIPGTIRIMTYNVRSCIGMDGKISPQRIARVIGRYEPDIVALQELDMNRKRTGEVDQAHLIARELEMIFHFHPSIVIDEECYGDAVLSRFPMELIRAGRLPGIIKNSMVEPRGVIWTSINIGKAKINFFNTHLGLYPREGINQTKALLGEEWLAHPACQGPIILCGDFNALPNSKVCRDIKKVFRDAQEELDDYSPQATWFSHYPVGRIDHIFISPGIKVSAIDVPKTQLNKMASDHLPLIADLEVF